MARRLAAPLQPGRQAASKPMPKGSVQPKHGNSKILVGVAFGVAALFLIVLIAVWATLGSKNSTLGQQLNEAQAGKDKSEQENNAALAQAESQYRDRETKTAKLQKDLSRIGELQAALAQAESKYRDREIEVAKFQKDLLRIEELQAALTTAQ